jgi:hypothetical protein
MATKQDPIMNDSGSARIEICMRLAEDYTPDLGRRIQAWIHDIWMPTNLEWERVWKTGANLDIIAKRERLQYGDDFLRSPQISLTDNSKLLVHLCIKLPAKNWRDWFILRFLPDLRTAFPEITDELPDYIVTS